jgi:tetratricopeptide (TPR) repeat protein
VILVTVIVAFVLITRARNLAVAARDSEQQQRIRAEQNLALATDVVQRFYRDVSSDPRLQTPGLEQLRGALRELPVKYFESLKDKLGDDPKFRNESLAARYLLADFAMSFGDLPRAQLLLTESIRMQRELAASNPLDEKVSRDLANALNLLGQVMHALGKLDEARKHYDESAAMLQGLLEKRPDDDQLTLAHSTIVNNIGTLFRDMRQFEQSEVAYKKALAMRQGLAGKAGPILVLAQEAIATSCTDIGLLLDDQEKFEQAIDHYTRAVRARQAVAGMRPEDRVANSELALAVGLLGEAQLRTGKLEEARANLMRSMQIWQEMMSNPRIRDLSPANATAFLTIAWLELLAGDPNRALEAANRAEFADPDRPEVRLSRAHALLFAGKVDEARAIYRDNWLRQIPHGGTFAQRALEDFATLRRCSRGIPAMQQIEAEMSAVSLPAP